MRVLVHDYSGHPFQVQLSRALAHRGHEVLHVHCSSYQTGKGALQRRADDAEGFRVRGIDLGAVFDRYSVMRRVRQELDYGARFTRVAEAFEPDVVLSSNDPLLAKTRAARWCRRQGVPWVFWLQDVYSLAMAGYAGQRLGPAGRVIGRGFQALERRLLRQAAAVVPITADFDPVLSSWRVPQDRRHVIENWAPLDELPPRPKVNPWSVEHGLHDRHVFLYAGTLGLKHDPSLLVALAEAFVDDPEVRVVVVSEGKGAAWLAQARAERGLDNLVVLPYQPFDRLPDVFGAADVLLVLLEANAGTFSVPSKVLSYLCAGRPVLAAMPAVNQASRTIEGSEAGMVVNTDDVATWVQRAEKLRADPALRQFHGGRARAHAERAFDIDAIADRFERILQTSVSGARPTTGSGTAP
jgi:glycosyltransferase involved in cell wall biosynthesis